MPEGSLQVDPAGKGTGRGAYLCGAAICWERAVSKGVLERGLRSPLSGADKEYLKRVYQENVQENLEENQVKMPPGVES